MAPREVIPVQELDKHGFIADTPAVNLPLGAWTDVQNVRFDDGAIRKFKGEIRIFNEGTEDDILTNIRFITYWENPNERVYVVINETGDTIEGEHRIYTVSVNDEGEAIVVNRTPLDEFGIERPFTVPIIDASSNNSIGNQWQGIQFNGGFSIVVNNGIEQPHHITVQQGVTLTEDINFVPLPGWDSYISGSTIAETLAVRAGIIIPNGNILLAGALTEERLPLVSTATLGGFLQDDADTMTQTNPTSITFANQETFENGDIIRLVYGAEGSEVTTDVGIVNADNPVVAKNNYTVIPAPLLLGETAFNFFGQVLRTIPEDDITGVYDATPGKRRVTIRSLNGVVRSSDVAAPGEIPENWNPFAVGVGTADELTLADTGRITAMRNLKGNVFVYTAQSIIQLRITEQGLRSTLITDQYGALTQNSVYEFQGQHFVIGSDDIYLFSGNPGDIKSVADGRVRRYFYDNISSAFYGRLWVERNQTFDELWVAYPTLNTDFGAYDEAIIWNYVNNTWTKRELPDIHGLTQGPIPGGGNLETLVDFIGGNTTSQNVAGTQSVNNVTVPDDFDPRIQGTTEIQTINWTGSRSIVRDAGVETIEYVLPGNLMTGPDSDPSTWSFDPDLTDALFGTDVAVPTTNFTAGINSLAAAEEMGLAIGALDPAISYEPGSAVGSSAVAIDLSFDIPVNPNPVVDDVSFFPNTLMDQSIESARGINPITYGTTIDTTKALFIGKRINSDGDFWWADNAPRPDGTVPDRLPGISTLNISRSENTGFNSFGDGEYIINDAGIGTGAGLNINGGTYYSLRLSAQPNFMDIVHYSGTGVARQITHDLDEAPGMMLVKSTTDNTEHWHAFHHLGEVSSGTQSGRYANRFNDRFGFFIDDTVWNGTLPNSTTFTVGTSTKTNEVGSDYVAYLFADNPDGNVICGEYDVVRDEDTVGKIGGFFVPLPWEPEVVWIKNTRQNQGWQMFSSILNSPDIDLDQKGLDVALTLGLQQPSAQLIRIQGKGFRLISNNARTGQLNTDDHFVYIAMRSARSEDSSFGGTFYDGDYGLTPQTVPTSWGTASNSNFLGTKRREVAANSGTRTLGTGQNLRGSVVADNTANEVVFGANANTNGGSGTGFVGGVGGSHNWTVPAGVTSVSMVAVGGGGGGFIAQNGSGGGGGALSYRNNVPVTPGEVLEITVGRGGIWVANTNGYEFASASTVVRDTGNLMILQANFGVRGNTTGMNQRTASGRGGGLPTDFSATNYTAYNTAASPSTADYASNLGGFGGSGNNNSASAGGGGGAAGYLGEGARDGFAGGASDTMTFTNGVNAGGGAGTGSQASFRAGGGGGGTGTQGFSSRRRSTANGITQYGGGGARYSQTSSQNSGGRYDSWSWPGEGYAGGTDGDVSWNADGSNNSRRNKGGNGGFPGGGGGGSLSFDNLQFGTQALYPVNNVDPYGNGGFGQVRIIWGNQSDGTTPRQFPDGECETISYEDPKTMSLFIPWQSANDDTEATIWDTERGNLNYLNIAAVSGPQFTRGLGMREWGTEGPVIGRGTAANRSVGELIDFNINALFPTPTTTWDGFANLNFIEGDTFDVVQYTGDGTSGQVIPHNLGANLSFIWIKVLDANASWTVLHKDNSTRIHTWATGTGSANNSRISIDAAGEVTVNDHLDVGANGNEYIAYLFADVPDQGSATGTFTGIAATDQVIDLGFKPDVFMIKAVNVSGASGHWWLFFRDASVDDIESPTWRMGGGAPYYGQPVGGNVHFNGNTVQLNGNVLGVNSDQMQSVWFAVGKGSSVIEGDRTTVLAAPDFAVYDENGVLVEMTDTAALMALGAGGAANAAIFAAGVNALETGTANWTATATDNSVQLVTDIYASDMNSDAVATTTATGLENVVDGTGTFDPALVSGEFFSGRDGGSSFVINITTETALTQILTLNQGGGVRVALGSSSEDHVVDARASEYFVRDTSTVPVTSSAISSFVTDENDSDIDTVLGAIIGFINSNVESPINFNTPTLTELGSTPSGDTGIVLTAAITGDVASTWVVTADHPDATGDLAFTVPDEGITHGTDDTFRMFNVTIDFPEETIVPAEFEESREGETRETTYTFTQDAVDGQAVVDGRTERPLIAKNFPAQRAVITISAEGSELLQPYEPGYDVTNIILADEIAARITRDLPASVGFTPVSSTDDVVLTRNVVGPYPHGIEFVDDISLGTWTTTETNRGADPTVEGNLTVSTFNPRFQTVNPILDEDPQVLQGIVDLNTTFHNLFDPDDTPTFVNESLPDEDLTVDTMTLLTSLQFGNQAISFDYELDPGTVRRTTGVLVDHGDRQAEGYAVHTDVWAARSTSGIIDVERPWSTGVLNEARNFIVGAGGPSIWGFDVGDTFHMQNGDPNTNAVSFVERKGLELAPLKDTEMVSALFVNASGDEGEGNNFVLHLTGTDNASTPVTFPAVDLTSPEQYNYVFSGDDADYKIDTRITSRLINMRIENTSELPWEIQNMSIETSKGGTR